MQELSRRSRRNATESAKPSETDPAAPASDAPSAAATTETAVPGKQDTRATPEAPPTTDAKDVPKQDAPQAQPSAKSASAAPESAATPMAVFAGVSDKAKRTELHAFFRNDLGLPKLVTDTVKNADESVDIRVMAQTDLKATVRKCAPRAQHPVAMIHTSRGRPTDRTQTHFPGHAAHLTMHRSHTGL